MAIFKAGAAMITAGGAVPGTMISSLGGLLIYLKKNVTMKTSVLGNVLLLGLIVVASAFLCDVFQEKRMEDMTIDELKDKLAECIKRDTTESYLEAVKIRDIIKVKRNISGNL